MRTSLLISVASVLAGCAQILDIPDDPALVGPWRCLGEPPQQQVPRATLASVQVQACDFYDRCATAVTGLTARLCQAVDVDCTNPVAVDIVDVGGLLAFDVPTGVRGFVGYLEVTSPTDLCTSSAFGDLAGAICDLADERCNRDAPDDFCRLPTYARAMLFFNPPIFNDVPQVMQLPLISAKAMPAMLEAAGAQLNPSTGNLFITALDCDGRPAAGVTYTIGNFQDRVTQLYLHNSFPDRTDLQTDSSGVGGFLGVPAGQYVQVSGFNSNVESVGEIGLATRPFSMSYGLLTPLAPPPSSF
jgi:hypothetical protein